MLAEYKQKPEFNNLLKRYEDKPACENRTLEIFLTYPMHQVRFSSLWCCPYSNLTQKDHVICLSLCPALTLLACFRRWHMCSSCLLPLGGKKDFNLFHDPLFPCIKTDLSPFCFLHESWQICLPFCCLQFSFFWAFCVSRQPSQFFTFLIDKTSLKITFLSLRIKTDLPPFLPSHCIK